MPEKRNQENCNAIYLRSGKELNGELTREPPSKEADPKDKEIEKASEVEDEDEVIPEEGKKSEEPKQPPVKPVVPIVPYPGRLRAQKDDIHYSKFLDIFKKLTINIPFADALAQMPSYARFMKEILSKKRKINDQATVALTEECSAIIQNKLPTKLKDPGSFSIPIQISNLNFDRVLCDLGASINLMPLSIFRKLGLGEVSPTLMTLKLADGSMVYPHGIVEDVLVKVGKFYFPVDFVVIDIDEDEAVPMILGRSFLATSRALIDVEEGEITFRVGGEKVRFKMFTSGVHRDGGDRGKKKVEESAENRKCGRFNTADTKPS